MDTQLIETVKNLMQKIPNNCHGSDKFAVNPEWLTQSERKYQIKLPEHYQWFVLHYDYIVLWGEITKTVAPPEHQDEADQDIFNYHMIDIESDAEKETKLVFLVTEDLREFYFPIVNNVVQETVFLWDGFQDIDDYYAENFLEFLLKEIPKNYPV